MTYLSAAGFAEEAAKHADSAVRVMNDAEMDQFRDRAFEEMGFAVHKLSLAVAELASTLHRKS